MSAGSCQLVKPAGRDPISLQCRNAALKAGMSTEATASASGKPFGRMGREGMSRQKSSSWRVKRGGGERRDWSW